MRRGISPSTPKARDERPEYVVFNGRMGALMDDALRGLAGITSHCVACHASYRLDEAR